MNSSCFANSTRKCFKQCSLVLLFTLLLLGSFSQAKAAPGDLKWSKAVNCKGGNSFSPAIGSDGTVYFGTGNAAGSPLIGHLYAYKPDGTLKWQYPETGDPDIGVIDFAPVIGSDGTIYFGTQEFTSTSTFISHIYALKSDGTLKWQYPKTGEADLECIHTSPAIGSDGTIYFVTTSAGLISHLHALKSDGTLKWQYPGEYENGLLQVYSSSLAIDSDGTIYVVSDMGGMLYAVNPDGTAKWDSSQLIIPSSPAIGSDGTIYLGIKNKVGDNQLVAYTPDGIAKWPTPFTASSDIHSSPTIGRDGTIYFGTNDNKLYALNPDGTAKWANPFSASAGYDIYSSPAIGKDGTIYFGSEDGKLYALNPDGTAKWATPFLAGSAIFSSPAIGSDGTIYICSINTFYAIEGNSGGLADSPWPKVHNNNQNTGRPAISCCVQAASTQASGVTVSVSASCAKEMDATELAAKYSAGGFSAKSTVDSFNATVTPSGASGVFMISSTQIPTGKVSDLTLMKFFSTGTSASYKTYAASGPEYTIDGTWWLTDANDKHMGFSDPTTLGTEYHAYFVIKDNGDYDEDKNLGKITDPVAVGVGSGSSNGCVLNPQADSSAELAGLFLFALVGILLRIRKGCRK